MSRAACRDKPLHWFFPTAGGSRRRAYATCATCPVQAECAEYAERSGVEYGIWGGDIMRRTTQEATDATKPSDDVGTLQSQPDTEEKA